MDIEILLFLQDIRNALGGALNTFFVFISTIAVDYFILVPALIIFWNVDKRKGSQIIMSWGTSLCLNAVAKAAFCIYRPWIRDPRVQPPEEIFSGASGYSFPSGHSSSGGGFWNAVVIAYRKYKPLVVMGIIMVALTMFARVFLGVHTIQDIFAGCLISIVSAVAIAFVMKWLDRHPELDWIVMGAATIIVVAALIYVRFKSYPVDMVDGKVLVDPEKMKVDGFKDPGMFYGIVLGWFLERKLVKFDVSGTKMQKVMRALVGCILTVFWYTAVAGPIAKAAGMGIVHFVAQASTPLIFMTVYPLIFTKIQNRVNAKKQAEEPECTQQ